MITPGRGAKSIRHRRARICGKPEPQCGDDDHQDLVLQFGGASTRRGILKDQGVQISTGLASAAGGEPGGNRTPRQAGVTTEAPRQQKCRFGHVRVLGADVMEAWRTTGADHEQCRSRRQELLQPSAVVVADLSPARGPLGRETAQGTG